jgi:hypothetical protein
MIFEKLKLNPKNPRKIKKEDFNKLKQSILDFPEMLEKRPIVYDEDFVILGGNMRFKAISELVKNGFEVKDSYFLNAKDWSEEQKRKFVIKDNIEAGEWDLDILESDWSDLDLEGFGLDLNLKNENPYTSKIDTPHYEITGIKPEFEDMYDKEKFNELVKKINEKDLDEKTKEFLITASYRHIVFNYENIAEFYAHSDKEVQKLMEDNALVIIDFNNAIENGFAELTENIIDVFNEDYNNKNE